MTKNRPAQGLEGRIKQIRTRMTRKKNRLRNAAMQDMTDPANRRRAMFHFHVHDHAFIRLFWSNFAQVAPGVFRSNHPSRHRIRAYAARGITTIINLRGASDTPHYYYEVEACRAFGITLIDNEMTARSAPTRQSLLSLIDIMRTTSKPFLLHCKSGADRSSLASAIYLLVFCGASVARARTQFSLRFIHFKWTQTGVLDHILNRYEIAQNQSGIDFEDWIKSAYDPAEIQASFQNRKKAQPK
jgi:protein tyrosine phosphatase (PTP) superfamily phosphohydrolase (DUF442 family)